MINSVSSLPEFDEENLFPHRTPMWVQQEQAIEASFRAQVQDFFDELTVTQDTWDVIHSKAWADGHHGGYSEVFNCYHDLVDFVLNLMRANQ